MQHQLAGLALPLEWLEIELAVAKRALARALTPTPSPPAEPAVPKHKLRIPEPVAFGGVRSSKELDNFIWDVE